MMEKKLRIIRFSLVSYFLFILALSSCSSPIVRPDQTIDQRGSIGHGAFLRTYLIHIPPSYDQTKPTPLVLCFHAANRTGSQEAQITGFDLLADKRGFIIIYPDGIDNSWNDGRGGTPAERKGVNDIGFVVKLIERLMKTYNVDPKRIYATGRSNGAIFAYRLACELPEMIAAIAPVTGAMPAQPTYKCKYSPVNPVSVLAINGTEDQYIPWNGGEAAWGKILSVPQTIMYWVKLNGLFTQPRITYEPDRDPNDGTRVRREVYGPGQKGSEVVLYGIEGGGHTWPGGKATFYIGAKSGRVCHDINAAEIIWDFFERHPKQ